MALDMKKLKKLKMPTARAGEKEQDESIPELEGEMPEFELEFGGEKESSSGEVPEAEKEGSGSAALEAISDEELMAELRKRGLEGKLQSSEDMQMSDEMDQLPS